MQDKVPVSMPSEAADRVVSGAAFTLAAPAGASVVPAAPVHGAVALAPTALTPTAPAPTALAPTAPAPTALAPTALAPTALAASTLAAPAGALVVPVTAPVHGAVAVTVASGHTANAAAAPASDVDDPFKTDDAMDTREDWVNQNFSSVRVPHPFELQEPNPRPTNYFVVNVGTPVGIIGDLELSSIDLHRQPQLAFTRCNGWYEAVGYYTINFRNGNIRLVPLGADAPARPNNIQHVTITEHASGVPLPLHPPVGSASNPIYVGSPDTAGVVAGPTQNPRTPTPAARSTRDRGTGPFRIPVPIPVRRGAPIPGATRIRRRRRQSASNTASTTTTAPALSGAAPAPGGALSGIPTAATAATSTAVTSTAVTSTAVTSTAVTSTAVMSTAVASTAAASTTAASTAASSNAVASSIPASGCSSGAAPSGASAHAPIAAASSSSSATNATNGAVNDTHKVINVSDFSDVEPSRQVPQKRQARDTSGAAPSGPSGSGSASNNGVVDGTRKAINVSDFSDVEPSRQVPQKRQARDIVPQIDVHDSDSDGPNFLPSYPQSQTSRPRIDIARTTPPTTDRPASPMSSPLTEIGPTAPPTPQPGEKVFQPLFSIGGVSCKGKGKGKDKGKARESSPILEHLLRSNKRYKLTDTSRSLFLSGADPSSLPTNIPALDGADRVAGPSSVPTSDAPTVDAPPVAGPSNSHVSDASTEDGNDGDDEDDGLVNNEYPHWDFNSDEIDEVGRLMDEAWKHSHAKRK
ncbi:hypothetical protein BDN70DRAFT_901770 [Pholiota conissans]|uniref:Uncharacterized protein n=1 Tax=Pholiota conissans TaxID=109636 RepID=A0A9P5YL18_9AGAR|nr:hypothetical protein BDN70DRAFT_901770 [Pholiota conissans]